MNGAREGIMLLYGVMEIMFRLKKGTVHWRPYLLLVGGDSGEGTKSPWLSAAEEDVIPSSYPSSTSFSSEKTQKVYFHNDLHSATSEFSLLVHILHILLASKINTHISSNFWPDHQNGRWVI